MKSAQNAAKVGAFAVVTVSLAVFGYRYVTKGRAGEGSYTVYALMEDATGIAQHSQVKVAGIPIGSIEKVSLEGDRARIDIAVNPDVHLYEDATATKASSSLLGEYFLKVTPGTEGRRELHDGDRIEVVVEGASTDAILREVNEIAKDVRRVSQALANSIGTRQGEDDLKATLHNLAQVTEALNETVRENRRSVREILVNVERMSQRTPPEVERILENVRETTKEVRVLTERAKTPETEDGEVRQIIDKLNRASTSLENSMKDVEVVTDRLEKGEGNLGRLSKDEHLIDEVEGVAEGVNSFVSGITRLRTVVSLRTDYQFLASTVKSFVEIRLQPREDKYYSIELVNDPRGNTLIQQVDVISTNPNDPPQYREIRTVTTNDFRFSLQFAQRLGPFWGRFGIKESTGGVGLDTVLFEDRFEFRQDLFGFGERSIPRYRLWTSYEFVPRLWLLGGVDDLFSDDRRDYFLGLQLRFDDRDLKTVLPFVPSL